MLSIRRHIKEPQEEALWNRFNKHCKSKSFAFVCVCVCEKERDRVNVTTVQIFRLYLKNKKVKVCLGREGAVQLQRRE